VFARLRQARALSLARGCMLSRYSLCLVECEGPEVCAAAGIMRRSSRWHCIYNSFQTSVFMFSGLLSKEARRERESVCVCVCVKGQQRRCLLQLPCKSAAPEYKSHPSTGSIWLFYQPGTGLVEMRKGRRGSLEGKISKCSILLDFSHTRSVLSGESQSDEKRRI